MTFSNGKNKFISDKSKRYHQEVNIMKFTKNEIERTKADLMVLELAMMTEEPEFFEESGAYDIVKTITSKIQKLIIKMSSWLKKIRVDVDVMIMEHEKNQRFKDLENLIKNDPKGKKKKIYFCNVSGAVELYQKYMRIKIIGLIIVFGMSKFMKMNIQIVILHAYIILNML